MGNSLCCHPHDLQLKRADNKIPLHSFNGQKFRAKVVDVYDGDTITIVRRYHGKLTRLKVRLLGFDAPEMRTDDPKEKELAIAARDKLRELILNKIVVLDCQKFDKYGRILANIYLKSNWCCCGSNLWLNEYMLENVKGCYAYDGGNKAAQKAAAAKKK